MVLANGSIVLSTEGEGITLVYALMELVGWQINVKSNDFSTVGSNFVAATGGTDYNQLVQILKFILSQVPVLLQ